MAAPPALQCLRRRSISSLGVLLVCASPWPAQAVSPTSSEMPEARRRSATQFEAARRCCSFLYDGQPSSESLSAWELQRTTRELDPQRMEHTANPGCSLSCRALALKPHTHCDQVKFCPSLSVFQGPHVARRGRGATGRLWAVHEDHDGVWSEGAPRWVRLSTLESWRHGSFALGSFHHG